MVIEMPSMKSGDAADEILGRPAFHYVKEKAEVELTLVSAAELGIPPELPHGTSGGGLRVSLLARGSGRAASETPPPLRSWVIFPRHGSVQGLRAATLASARPTIESAAFK
jgi:hypothetical protein